MIRNYVVEEETQWEDTSFKEQFFSKYLDAASALFSCDKTISAAVIRIIYAVGIKFERYDPELRFHVLREVMNALEDIGFEIAERTGSRVGTDIVNAIHMLDKYVEEGGE